MVLMLVVLREFLLAVTEDSGSSEVKIAEENTLQISPINLNSLFLKINIK